MNLELIQRILLWCTIINCVLLTLSIILIMLFHKMIYSLHSKFPGLTEEKVAQSLYLICGIYKVLIFMFNIVPLVVLYII